MMTELMLGFGDFLNKQWTLIISILTGLAVLYKVKHYIEENAVTAEQKAHLMNAINRSKEVKEIANEADKTVNDLERDELLGFMHDQGYLRAE